MVTVDLFEEREYLLWIKRNIKVENYKGVILVTCKIDDYMFRNPTDDRIIAHFKLQHDKKKSAWGEWMNPMLLG